MLVTIRSALARAVPRRVLGAALRVVYPRVEPELACLDDWAPQGGTALDVGAWYGPWTARLSRRSARVVTIEPNPSLAATLRAAFPAAQVVQAAASDEAGTIRLWLPGGGRGAEGLASVEHPSPSGRHIHVPRETIDRLGLSDVRFIKMDVEGHEAAALRGAAATIARDRPVLLLELETRHQRVEDVIGMLGGWGYQGSVLTGDGWIPLDGFDLAGHQKASARTAARGLAGRLLHPRERYINLVRFVPVAR